MTETQTTSQASILDPYRHQKKYNHKRYVDDAEFRNKCIRRTYCFVQMHLTPPESTWMDPTI